MATLPQLDPADVAEIGGRLRDNIRRALKEREAIWIVEREGELAGCLGLTDDGDAGVVRWFVLDPSVRGRGLGRRLLDELVDHARGLGYERLRLERFSLLRAAARLYRSHGFEVVDEDTAPRWGHDAITFQRYELDLRPSPRARYWAEDGVGQRRDRAGRLRSVESRRSRSVGGGVR